MFTKNTERSSRLLIEGVRLKSLAWGEHTLLTEVHLDKGAVVPIHDHPQEQTGYLVSGRLEFDVAGEKIVAEPGDSWSLPADQAHGAVALEACLVVEVFSPVREDYLPEEGER
jgi:quercetin dioxygenase-like cupin family protein